MKKKTRDICLIAMTACMTLVSACGNTKESTNVQQVEGLEEFGDIEVVTREDGSGTRGVFAEALGLVEHSEENESKDRITEQGKIAMDAEAVVEEVKQESTAIGYVSLGALTDQIDGIKVIQIDGIEANTDTITKGDYPLSRDFNLAYSGELTEAENDFMTYIMSEGQEIVAENYIEVEEADTFLSDQSKGKIEITGSTSMAPLLESLAESYQKRNSNVEIEVAPSDSTSGLTQAMQESCDFGMASRNLKDYEKELLQSKTIARDGIAVIVNEKNPVENLTTSQLADIFSGEDTKWNDINER